jgi:L-lactate dehydrogenase complex protein LldE
MRVGLFIPCYIEQFYPQVGLATAQVLERYGATVEYPLGQTCCGQPMANMGCQNDARPVAEHFLDLFEPYDYVVGPSGSCVSMVRNHYDPLFEGPRWGEQRAKLEKVRKKTFELCEFLYDVLEIRGVEGRFPYRVGLHQGCHGLRELGLGRPSERMVEPFNKVRTLLESLEGIEFSQLERPDECCGFGGTFSVTEEAISCLMGLDRLRDHQQAGTEVLTSVDMSCLMHQEGLLRREVRGGGPLSGDGRVMRVMHVAEIFTESALPGQESP